MLSRQITMTTHWQHPSQGLCYGLTLQYPHRLMHWSIWRTAGDAVCLRRLWPSWSKPVTWPWPHFCPFSAFWLEMYETATSYFHFHMWPSPPRWTLPSQTVSMCLPIPKLLLIRYLILYLLKHWYAWLQGPACSQKSNLEILILFTLPADPLLQEASTEPGDAFLLYISHN